MVVVVMPGFYLKHFMNFWSFLVPWFSSMGYFFFLGGGFETTTFLLLPLTFEQLNYVKVGSTFSMLRSLSKIFVNEYGV